MLASASDVSWLWVVTLAVTSVGASVSTTYFNRRAESQRRLEDQARADARRREDLARADRNRFAAEQHSAYATAWATTRGAVDKIKQRQAEAMTQTIASDIRQAAVEAFRDALQTIAAADLLATGSVRDAGAKLSEALNSWDSSIFKLEMHNVRERQGVWTEPVNGAYEQMVEAEESVEVARREYLEAARASLGVPAE